MGEGLKRAFAAARATQKRERHKAGIWQGGSMVASVEGSNLKQVLKECCHYVFMYAQDGPVKVTGTPRLMQEFRTISGSEKYL